MLKFLERVRGMLGNQSDDDEWPSIVFLLRKPVLPDANQAIEMARVVWGAAGLVELVGSVGPHNFLIRVIPLTFALHAVGSRYEVDAGSLNAFQQQCWSEHNAWLSIDLPGKRIESLRQSSQLAPAYKALMYFVQKHWSPNCSALYFPGEQTTLPNYGDLIESIRFARRDGINLDFLKESKS